MAMLSLKKEVGKGPQEGQLAAGMHRSMCRTDPGGQVHPGAHAEAQKSPTSALSQVFTQAEAQGEKIAPLIGQEKSEVIRN